MRVLVLSAETWRDDSNGGNVLSNIFNGLPYTYAQIYCNPGDPFNSLCKDYYQITDRDVIDYLFKPSIRKQKRIGRVRKFENYPQNQSSWESGAGNTAIYKIAKKMRFESMYVAQEILWGMVPLENLELKKFVEEFNPDVIFAPCYASHRMLRLARYLKQITGKPIISYISDDNYSLKQFKFSPVFWINRLVLRKHMRQTIPMYSLLYTMADEQKDELEKVFDVPIKVLRKHGDFEIARRRRNKTWNRIRLIYAGGIYLNRWKTLAELARCISVINNEGGVQFQLDIYTNNDLSKTQTKKLNIEDASYVHKAVPYDQLTQLYKESDIAIHCESFDIKYEYDTRLSFSTKIIDCLHSGCAVLAIAWEKHSGLIYLRREDAAFCVDNMAEIESVLRKIKNSPELIDDYAEKAWQCGRRNHNTEDIRRGLSEDFQRVVEGE